MGRLLAAGPFRRLDDRRPWVLIIDDDCGRQTTNNQSIDVSSVSERHLKQKDIYRSNDRHAAFCAVMTKAPRKPTWPDGMRRRESLPFDRGLRTLSKREILPDVLPLVHVTTVWNAKEVVAEGRFETGYCDVFQRELLFFFVMRPAYRSRFGGEQHHQLTRFPVAFILDPGAVPDPLHVYPFDTGGAAKGAFSTQADPQIPLEDYALLESHDGAGGHIEWAFGTLDNYLRGLLRTNLRDSLKEFDFVPRGYLDIARMGRTGSNEHDKRASSVEIAASHDVELSRHVRLAILPRQFLAGNSDIMRRLVEIGADVELYDWRPNTMPDEYQDEIADIAREWYRKAKLL